MIFTVCVFWLVKWNFHNYLKYAKWSIIINILSSSSISIWTGDPSETPETDDAVNDKWYVSSVSKATESFFILNDGSAIVVPAGELAGNVTVLL